ncbi:hypothetical protein Tco_0272995 [Tanacetum coccineum]
MTSPSMPCGNDSSGITTFTTMMLSIDQIISWIGFHLTVYGSIACARDSPKNVNNDSVSPSSRVLREEDVRGVESDLVDSFEEGENSWLIVVMFTTDDKKMLRSSALLKSSQCDSIIALNLQPPGVTIEIVALSLVLRVLIILVPLTVTR